MCIKWKEGIPREKSKKIILMVILVTGAAVMFEHICRIDYGDMMYHDETASVNRMMTFFNGVMEFFSEESQIDARQQSDVFLPRSLAKYLILELEWEIGGDRVLRPSCFFDLDALEKNLQLTEEDLASVFFVTEIGEDILYTAGRYEIRMKADNMELITYLKVQDTTPPNIIVPMSSEYIAGDSILYRKGVRVEDNSREEPWLEIDSSMVCPNMAGTYPVYYTAVDNAGNKGTAVSEIMIRQGNLVTEEEVSVLAAEVLSSILTENMDKLQQAKAIFDWCRNNIRSTANANKSGILQGAYEGLYYRTGDCYTFFAVSAYLLTACEIENLNVSRAGEDTVHYWSLVNVGTGWYHFDCSINGDGYKCFMQTDEQVRVYGEKYRESGHYYDFDEKDMPLRAVEILYENELL